MYRGLTADVLIRFSLKRKKQVRLVGHFLTTVFTYIGETVQNYKLHMRKAIIAKSITRCRSIVTTYMFRACINFPYNTTAIIYCPALWLTSCVCKCNKCRTFYACLSGNWRHTIGGFICACIGRSSRNSARSSDCYNAV